MPFQSSFPIPNFNRIAFAAWEVKNLERNSTVHLSGEIQTQVKQHQCCKIKLVRICACTGDNSRPRYQRQHVACVRLRRTVGTRGRHSVICGNHHRPV